MYSELTLSLHWIRTLRSIPEPAAQPQAPVRRPASGIPARIPVHQPTPNAGIILPEPL